MPRLLGLGGGVRNKLTYRRFACMAAEAGLLILYTSLDFYICTCLCYYPYLLSSWPTTLC